MRVKALYTLAGEKPARGAALFAPIPKLENPLIIIKNGIIADIRQPSAPITPTTRELEDTILIPPVINAHTHTQLSWLGGKTLWDHGFVPWLQSMVPQLLPTNCGFLGDMRQQGARAIAGAWRELAKCGTAWAGDIGGSIPGALSRVQSAASGSGVGVSHFCEWFGFKPDDNSPWPARCAKEVAGAISHLCAPAGHALYSTAAQTLQNARKWCAKNGRIFTFHLAESDEESEALGSGRGALVEYYTGSVLPPDWQAPGLRPVKYADKLGLLGPGVLAVHGVQMNGAEIALFAQSGASLCLCPRSNKNLKVGFAPVKKHIEAGILLCLGTDGLTSNTDLDVRNEALYLREKLDLPDSALLRMLTVNGAQALGLPPSVGRIYPGQPAIFATWPHDRTR